MVNHKIADRWQIGSANANILQPGGESKRGDQGLQTRSRFEGLDIRDRFEDQWLLRREGVSNSRELPRHRFGQCTHHRSKRDTRGETVRDVITPPQDMPETVAESQPDGSWCKVALPGCDLTVETRLDRFAVSRSCKRCRDPTDTYQRKGGGDWLMAGTNKPFNSMVQCLDAGAGL